MITKAHSGFFLWFYCILLCIGQQRLLSQDRNCGPRCVYIVARLLDLESNYPDLLEKMQKGDGEGASFGSLSLWLDELGCETCLVRISESKLLGLGLPAIVWREPANEGVLGHFVVEYPKLNGNLAVIDFPNPTRNVVTTTATNTVTALVCGRNIPASLYVFKFRWALMIISALVFIYMSPSMFRYFRRKIACAFLLVLACGSIAGCSKVKNSEEIEVIFDQEFPIVVALDSKASPQECRFKIKNNTDKIYTIKQTAMNCQCIKVEPPKEIAGLTSGNVSMWLDPKGKPEGSYEATILLKGFLGTSEKIVEARLTYQVNPGWSITPAQFGIATSASKADVQTWVKFETKLLSMAQALEVINHLRLQGLSADWGGLKVIKVEPIANALPGKIEFNVYLQFSALEAMPSGNRSWPLVTGIEKWMALARPAEVKWDNEHDVQVLPSVLHFGLLADDFKGLAKLESIVKLSESRKLSDLVVKSDDDRFRAELTRGKNLNEGGMTCSIEPSSFSHGEHKTRLKILDRRTGKALANVAVYAQIVSR